jgi:hypothetical protein
MARNITFHCDYCQKVLGADRYTVSPFTLRPCASRAWCPACYEMLRAWMACRGYDGPPTK